MSTENKVSLIDKLYALDRRIIFIFVFIAVFVPFLVKFNLPVKPTKNVKNIYDTIEKIAAKPNGGTVLISTDFDPASEAELGPMLSAVTTHIMRHKGKIKLVVLTNWPNSPTMTETILKKSAEETKAEYGKDWVFLGYKSGYTSLIINMGQDFYNAFPQDSKGTDLKKMEATKDLTSLRDLDYMIEFAAGAGTDTWVVYGQSRYKFLMAACTVAVVGPDNYPYLQAGQINGLMSGLAGAAEYEVLINKPGIAVEGMKPQSIGHLVLLLFIILGNIMYFIKKRELKKNA